MPRFKRYQFVAESQFPFPLDMLRYDACYPADSESVVAISESLLELGRSTMRRVKLIRVGETPPTEGRWHSFTWRIADVQGIR